MNIFNRLAIFLGITLQLLLLATPTFAQTEATIGAKVNSYELFFPITAGKVMGESWYFLKSFKEGLRELLIFSDLKKTDYSITMSEKRLAEAEKLYLDKKDFVNGKKSLAASQKRREQALGFINKISKENSELANLKNRLISSLEKQRALLQYIITQVSEDIHPTIDENLSQLNSILAKLQ